MTPTPEIIRIITSKPELVDIGHTPFTSEIYMLHFLLLIAFALFIIPLLIRLWLLRNDENNSTPDNNLADNEL